jgi:hypothetical protein
MPLTDREMADALIEAIRDHADAQGNEGGKVYAGDRRSFEIMQKMNDANGKLWDTANTLIGLYNK